MNTLSGQLARRGFGDAGQAAEIVTRLTGGRELEDDPFVDGLLEAALRTADPDLALGGLDRLPDELCAELRSDPEWAARVVALLGGTAALHQHLVQRPEDARAVTGTCARRSADEHRRALLDAVGADPDAHVPVAEHASGDELRLAYRRSLLPIAARDLTSVEPEALLDDIAGELADLADAALETALAVARAQVPDHALARLAVIALGKCGAQELNYISDVDVLYIAEPALDDEGREICSTDQALSVAAKLAGTLGRICSAHTAAGTIWQVDAALRPEGKAGPLVRTLASHRAYYEKWAKNWEFQAMLKARPACGDLDLGQAFCDMVWPLVWRVSERDGFLPETQAMRKRVISLIPAKEQGREIKLSAGGLRDVEFTVQLLQLVHGRTDERLRLRATLPGPAALVEHGYVGRRDGAELATAYRFQRTLEHRVQLFRLRRTHLLPDDEDGLRRLGRGLGIREPREVSEQWKASARRVQRLHQRMFYSPLLEAVARISSDELRLSTEAAATRLRGLGYADPQAGVRHIEALSTRVTRQAGLQRQLLPAMLGWFAEGPNPDHGLLAFRQVSEALGRTPWYLRALRDEGAMAEHMARILSSSRYAVDLLKRSPQTVQILADDAEIPPRSRAELDAEMASAIKRHARPEDALEAVRTIRRRELFRIAVGDILGLTDLDAVGQGLSDVTSATIHAALSIARRDVPDAPALAVIALGRWGGDELSYASDADAMFMIDDVEDQQAGTKAALTVISALRAMLHRPGPDPALDLDADLRPEGKSGPLVRTFSSYASYYGGHSSTWEAQALLRARPGGGDDSLSGRLMVAIAPLRYPAAGLDQRQLAEIRKLKARMETERVQRSRIGASRHMVDATRNVKLGPGGLSDVEWTVQLLQLQHGHKVEGLRTTRTLEALRAAVDADLMDAADAAVLAQAWQVAGRIRHQVILLRRGASRSLPAPGRGPAAGVTRCFSPF